MSPRIRSHRLWRTALLLSAGILSANVQATSFTSPLHRTEQCLTVPPLGSAKLPDKDHDREQKLCAYDFYGHDIALCPKNTSTSAAAKIIDIKGSGFTQDQFERSRCGHDGYDRLAKFKMTMNQHNTSGTTSTSSLMYYVFSRYLGTSLNVPVAVYRTIDKDIFKERVVERASGKSSMNRAAWAWLAQAIANPAAYNDVNSLFTRDRQQIYGVLLDDKGERYGAEINSARRSGWGAPQSREFQTTPAFTALRTDAPLRQAIAKAPYPAVQTVFWMRELSEIAVLDHIFSQQDRIGNIDYQWHWYWVGQDGEAHHRKVKSKLPRAKMAAILVPKDIAAFHPILLQRSWIGDNDAGLSPRYANFAKITNMVANLRHFNASEYSKLQNLAHDFQTSGPLLTQLKTSYGLTSSQLTLMIRNTIEVAAILKASCKAGHLHFDLSEKKFLKGENMESKISCEGL